MLQKHTVRIGLLTAVVCYFKLHKGLVYQNSVKKIFPKLSSLLKFVLLVQINTLKNMFRIVRGQCLRFITQILRHQVAVSNEKATICIFSGLNIKAAHVRTYSSEKNEHQIYQGPLASQIRLVKLFSLGSSIAGLALQPILYNQVQTAPGFAVVS